MVSRHAVPVVLFCAVAASLTVLAPAESRPATAPLHTAEPHGLAATVGQSRQQRAGRILREYLWQPDGNPGAATAPAGGPGAGAGGWTLSTHLVPQLTELRPDFPLERYLQAAATDTGATEQAIVQLRRARALAEARDVGAALVAWDRAAELAPALEDWTHVFAASAAATVGDTAEVRRRLGRVDDHLAAEWAWRTTVRARRQAGDITGALAAAQAAAARVQTTGRRAAAWTLVGQLRQERRDVQGARAAYIRAMNIADGQPAAVDAARALSALPGLSAGDQLLIGRVYLRHGNLARGMAGVQAYLDAGRGTPAERERLRYDMAHALFQSGDFAQAERALRAVADSAKDEAVVADALFTAARAQYRLRGAEPALNTLHRVVAQFGEQPAAARAAFLAADLHHDIGDMAAAVHYYRETIRAAPASDEAASAYMRLGSMAFAAGTPADALREFEAYRGRHIGGRPYLQATFWAGVTSARLGLDADARRYFEEVRDADPFTYYGGLAAEQLGDDSRHLHLEHAPAESRRFDAQVRGAFARVDLLRAAGLHDAATFEMERVRRHFEPRDGALYALAEAFNERGFIAQGVAIGRELYRREGAWNMRMLRIVYPFPFQDLIVAESAARNVDPFLAAALIRQESMFNPDARSRVGALGLMQVMPATARSLAGRLGVARVTDALLMQPDINVAFGTTYLADQLRVYGDRLDVVLAAYNAGPGRVTRWQRFPEYGDRLLFGERIPFEETRDYVRVVQHNRRMYTALYGPAAAADDAAAAR